MDEEFHSYDDYYKNDDDLTSIIAPLCSECKYRKRLVTGKPYVFDEEIDYVCDKNNHISNYSGSVF